MPDLEPVPGDPFAERFTGEPGKLSVEGPYFDPTKMPDWWARKIGPLRRWPGEGYDLDYGSPNPDRVLPPANYTLPYNPVDPHERGRFTPVGAFDLQPVSGDPFASMTHQLDQPAQPYMHPNVPAAASAIAGFAAGGLQGAGVQGPEWWQSNPIQRALQNPDNQVVLEAGIGRIPGQMNLRGQLGKFELTDLQKDFEAGLNNQQIASKYNVTKEAIQQRRTQMGYPPKPRGRPWPSRLEPVSHDPFAEE